MQRNKVANCASNGNANRQCNLININNKKKATATVTVTVIAETGNYTSQTCFAAISANCCYLLALAAFDAYTHAHNSRESAHGRAILACPPLGGSSPQMRIFVKIPV